ncbi:MAG TPA: hypothetical protein VF495_20980 [Phenylobacterium sp.]
MQSFRISAIAAVAVFVAGGAFAQSTAYRAEAKLVSATSAPHEETIAGAAWRCDGDACVGVAPRKANLDAPVRECKKVVAVMGPVAAYKTGVRELDAGQLKACNADAAKLETARN